MLFPPAAMMRNYGGGAVHPLLPPSVATFNAASADLGWGLFDPGQIWLFNEPGPPGLANPTDEVVGQVLTAVGTFEYLQAIAGLGSEVGLQLTVDSNDRLQGGTALFDIGANEPFCIIGVLRSLASPAGNDRTLHQKFATGVGYFLAHDSDGTAGGDISDGVNAASFQTVASVSDTTWAFWHGRTIASPRAYLYTSSGLFDTTVNVPTGSLVNGDQFRIGRFSTAGAIWGYLALVRGTGAAGPITGANFTAFNNHLGL